MGILDSILHAVTGAAQQQAPSQDQTQQTSQDQTTQQPQQGTGQDQASSSVPETLSGAVGAVTGAASNLGGQSIDSILDTLAEKTGCSNYKSSVVDLMKMFGVDSSHSAREELAKELGYDGDMSDSASMNEWLHTKLMDNIKEHGGKLTDLLKK